MSRALELLLEIEENINTCCAITMEPDEVQTLIDELRIILEE
jgi:hypothetical protein